MPTYLPIITCQIKSSFATVSALHDKQGSQGSVSISEQSNASKVRIAEFQQLRTVTTPILSMASEQVADTYDHMDTLVFLQMVTSFKVWE